MKNFPIRSRVCSSLRSGATHPKIDYRKPSQVSGTGRTRSERGFALIVVSFLILIGLFTAAAVSVGANKQLKNITNLINREKARYAAEAGLIDALRRLTDSSWMADTSATGGDRLNDALVYSPAGGLASGFTIDGFQTRYIVKRSSPTHEQMSNGEIRNIYLITTQGLNKAGEPIFTLQSGVFGWDDGSDYFVHVISQRERLQ